MGPGRPTHRETREPSISGAWFQYLARCLGDLGVPVDEICQDLQVDLPALIDPDVRVDRDTATLVWREAARRSSDPLLGLHAAEHFRLGLTNVVAHLMVSSDNLGEALSALGRYQTLVAAGNVLALERREETAVILVEPVEGRLPLLHHQVEFIVGAIAQIVRSITDPPATFMGVRFQHRCQAGTSAFRDFFGCPAEFRATENALVLSSVALKGPTRDRSPHMTRRLKAFAEEDLQARGGASIAELVELALWHRLRAREISRMQLEDVARDLHLSTRSLQRRLAEEAHTFADLLDQVRRDFALGLIEAGASRDEVATRLGFSRTKTLSTALRRWAS